nr:reverse transcriptase domain-containing protein [Tanacetum cinerariifolium]
AIRVTYDRPMRKRGFASWDGGNCTWGGRVEAMGTIPVCVCIGKAGERVVCLGGKIRIGPVAYKLELPDKLRGIHDTFHVSNLKRCFVNDDVVIPLDEVQLDDKLHFIEEPVEIMDREVKRLKQSRILIVKVR